MQIEIRMEFKMTGCVRWEGTDRGGEEGGEGADYAGGENHEMWIFEEKLPNEKIGTLSCWNKQWSTSQVLFCHPITLFQVRKKEMLRLMAKRKKSELKVNNSLESKSKKKKKGTEEEIGLREEVRLTDEQERLEQLEKRLESKVFNFVALIFYGHKLFPQILPTSLTFTNISHL